MYYFKSILMIQVVYKPFLFLFALLLINTGLNAQDCSGFFPFDAGTKIEMTQYDKKGKMASVTQTNIQTIAEVNGQLEAGISATVLDKKGKEVHTGSYNIACQGDGYVIDVADMLSPALMKGTYGMDVEVSGEALMYPNNLKVGDELPDASAEIEVSSGGMKVMTMTFNLSNRKVILEESVTTTVGTFNCYKLEYDFHMNAGFVKKTYKVVQWIAEGVGAVKDETYNEKGQLESSSELTSFERP